MFISEYIKRVDSSIKELGEDIEKDLLIKITKDEDDLTFTIPVANPKRRLIFKSLYLSISDVYGKELIIVNSLKGNCIGIFNLSSYLSRHNVDIGYFISRIDSYLLGLDYINDMVKYASSDSVIKDLLDDSNTTRIDLYKVLDNIESKINTFITSLNSILDDMGEYKVLKSFGKLNPLFTYYLMVISTYKVAYIKTYISNKSHLYNTHWIIMLHSICVSRGLDIVFLSLQDTRGFTYLVNLFKHLGLNRMLLGESHNNVLKDINKAVIDKTYFNFISKPNKYLKVEYTLGIMDSALKVIERGLK